ncbi:MAG TPA: hypothetical protein VFS20_23980 [Longimicrobium sp.]|nr:hypothetical protein [Longimicrobium sp.]
MIRMMLALDENPAFAACRERGDGVRGCCCGASTRDASPVGRIGCSHAPRL